MSKFNSCFKTTFFVFVLSSLVSSLTSAYAEAPRVVPEILDSVPHETSHFTQGLSFDGKEMIETTGLYGKSACTAARWKEKSWSRHDLKNDILAKVPWFWAMKSII